MKTRPLMLLAVLALALSSLAATFPFSFWKTVSGGGGGGGFSDPTSIGGLKLWLKADSLSQADGTAVATWTDSSGTSNTATQVTGANQPLFKTAVINGKPVLRFDGLNYNMHFPNDPGAVTTTFVVGKINVAPSSLTTYSPFVITNAAAGLRVLGRTSGTNWGTFVSADLNSGEDLVSGTAVILEMTTTDTPSNSTIIYRDGIQKATSSAHSSGGAGANYIGAEVGSGRYINADVAEVIIYDSVLSSTNRSNVEHFLGTKYGITVP